MDGDEKKTLKEDGLKSVAKQAQQGSAPARYGVRGRALRKPLRHPSPEEENSSCSPVLSAPYLKVSERKKGKVGEEIHYAPPALVSEDHSRSLLLNDYVFFYKRNSKTISYHNALKYAISGDAGKKKLLKSS